MSEALSRSILDRRKEMRSKLLLAATGAFWMGVNPYAVAQPQAASQAQAQMVADPVKILVDRLDLEQYKATIKGLTQFGDRRQGTDRNRAAIDWIEAQLKSDGCTNTERIKYDYQPPPARAGTRRGDNAQGGGRLRGIRTRTGV